MGKETQKASKTTLSKIGLLRLARKACRAPSRAGEQSTFKIDGQQRRRDTFFFDLLTRSSPTLAALGYPQLGALYTVLTSVFPHCHYTFCLPVFMKNKTEHNRHGKFSAFLC